MQSWKWEFEEWLDKVEIDGQPIPDDVKHDICYLVENGKMELE